MNWMLVDLRPLSNPRDGQPGDGTADGMLKLLVRAWPEAEHRFSVVAAARALRELQDRKDTCWATVLRTPEREKFIHYSMYMLVPPVALIVRGEAAARIPVNAAGEALLEQLFAQTGLRGLMTTGRSYGPRIDAALSAAGGNLHRVPGSTVGDSNRFEMLLRNRADYLLEFEEALNYQRSARPEPFNETDLRVLHIAGARPEPLGVGCPRSEWGRNAIQKIDRLLSQLAALPAYRETMVRGIGLESQRRYRKDFDRFVAERANESGRYP